MGSRASVDLLHRVVSTSSAEALVLPRRCARRRASMRLDLILSEPARRLDDVSSAHLPVACPAETMRLAVSASNLSKETSTCGMRAGRWDSEKDRNLLEGGTWGPGACQRSPCSTVNGHGTSGSGFRTASRSVAPWSEMVVLSRLSLYDATGSRLPLADRAWLVTSAQQQSHLAPTARSPRMAARPRPLFGG